MSENVSKKSSGYIIAAAGLIGMFSILCVAVFKNVYDIYFMTKTLISSEKNLTVLRRTVRQQEKNPDRHILFAKEEIPLAIEKITRTGERYHIKFISIIPQKIRKAKNSAYEALPIRIDLHSGYKALGLFLEALEKSQGQIMMVSGLQISRDEDIRPLVKASVNLELYLRDD